MCHKPESSVQQDETAEWDTLECGKTAAHTMLIIDAASAEKNEKY